MNRISRSAAWAATLFLATCGCSRLAKIVSPGSKAPEVHSPLTFGRLYERQGDVQQARQLYLTAAKEPATRAGALHRLAVLADRTGETREAEQYFEQAVRANASDAALWNDFGYHYLLAGQLVEAEGALRRALRLEPANARARNNLAVTLGEQGRMQESLEAFLRVLAPAEAYANVAGLHAQRGDHVTAMQLYEHALALDPTLGVAAEALAELDAHRRGALGGGPVIETVAASVPEAPVERFAPVGPAEFVGTRAMPAPARPVQFAAPSTDEVPPPALLPERVGPSAQAGVASIGFEQEPQILHRDEAAIERDRPIASEPQQPSDGWQPPEPTSGRDATAAPRAMQSGWRARR